MKEILLVSIGLNISIFLLSIAIGNTSGVWLAAVSSALCAAGLWFNSRQGDEEK
jgi:hypothetical protein